MKYTQELTQEISRALKNAAMRRGIPSHLMGFDDAEILIPLGENQYTAFGRVINEQQIVDFLAKHIAPATLQLRVETQPKRERARRALWRSCPPLAEAESARIYGRLITPTPFD